MATREKKITANSKKQSPVPTKEENNAQPNADVAVPENVTEEATTVAQSQDKPETPVKTKTAKKNPTKRLVVSKRTPNRKAGGASRARIAIRLKPKKKNATAVQIKKKIQAGVLNVTKSVAEGKKLLNKAKVKRPRRPKVVKVVSKSDKDPNEDAPPVLEPIFPIDQNLVDKSSNVNNNKKRGGAKPPKIDNYSAQRNSLESDSLLLGQNQPKMPRKVQRRKQNVDETIDDVMKDLSSLIESPDADDGKPESEADSANSVKAKDKSKIRRAAKKKENIENTLNKLSPADRKVIDMLDLTVRKFSTKDLPPILKKRRHSIEKYPMGNLHVFSSLPRCLSPRSKNPPKLRQSFESVNRRANPYKTRSDSPARILRNGKHRKLKDLELLDGLDMNKRRKRNFSEFSGSEVSKLSGYESDSSFSDMSSVAGADAAESKDDLKQEVKDSVLVQTVEDLSPLALTPKTEIADTVCVDLNKNLAQSPEVPTTKSAILDIMKQTFNDDLDESRKSLKTVSPSSFYAKKEIIVAEPKEEPVVMTKEEPPVEEVFERDSKDGGDLNGGMDVQPPAPVIVETPENLVIKESILQALGLQSLKAAKEAKAVKSKRIERMMDKNAAAAAAAAADAAAAASASAAAAQDSYTGTLKTVIKLNRTKNKRRSMKLSWQKKGGKVSEVANVTPVEISYKILKQQGPSTSWKPGGQTSDSTAGAHRKTHYSNRSNMDGSSEPSDGEASPEAKALVIPEKASSFSIHPDRLCKDVCSYCYGKFGLFDTPCHIAQMKSVERQDKILAAEKHLNRDSCLCDACYRHVDRKANTPSYNSKSYKRNTLVAPGPRQDHCHVLGCGKVACNILRRKWIIKMKKSILDVINVDLDNPGLHSIPICADHYSMLEHLMVRSGQVCAMCKRRLAKNHIYYLGADAVSLSSAMAAEGIPLELNEKPIICKLCKCFAAIVLKKTEDRPENSSSFFTEYKKRLLHFNDIVPMDEAAAEEPIVVPTKEKEPQLVQQPPHQQQQQHQPQQQQQPKTKKRKINPSKMLNQQQHQGGGGGDLDFSQVEEKSSEDQNSRVPSIESNNQSSRPESPSDYMVDYNTLIPSIAMECGSSDNESANHNNKTTLLNCYNQYQNRRPQSVKQAVEFSKKLAKGLDNLSQISISAISSNNNRSSDIAVQRLGSNPSISVRQLFPHEEDLPLQGCIEFNNVKERTPEGWEKCTSIIQYDLETKHLWNDLQKPYGNQSSFLRHLILLEKYFRSGDLVLAPNAHNHSVTYHDSVQNRLRAYDNVPTVITTPSVTIKAQGQQQKSNSGIITSQTSLIPLKSTTTPLTISQLNSPPLIPPTSSANQYQQNKNKSLPPGLISLQPGTNRPLVKLPQSQKIKFPITKNWRPTLIPIDPAKKPVPGDRRSGLVQVISGGKPYHISLEDYKKMCAIKKSFELKQKRLQESRSGAGVSLLKSSADNKRRNGTGDESILEKLDKQVESLETRFGGSSLSPDKSIANKSLSLPRIPKSLTVIPQTVPRKPSRPSSPVLLITPKPKQQVVAATIGKSS